MTSARLQPLSKTVNITHLISKQPKRFSVSAASEDAVREGCDGPQATQRLQQCRGRGAVTESRERDAEQPSAAAEKPQAASWRRAAAVSKSKLYKLRPYQKQCWSNFGL